MGRGSAGVGVGVGVGCGSAVEDSAVLGAGRGAVSAAGSWVAAGVGNCGTFGASVTGACEVSG